MTKRKENWISFQTPEGENRIGSPLFIKDLLGIDKLDNSFDDKINTIYSRLNRIEDRIDSLEYPRKKAKILDLLSNGESHNREWINNRVSAKWWIIDRALGELIEEKQLVTFKSGTQHMYTLPSSIRVEE